MGLYILRRLGAAAVLLFIVLNATFFLVHLAPGEPAVLFSDPRMGLEQRRQLRRIYGLDQPLAEQYGRWFQALARADLGASITHRRSAVDVLLDRLPNTATLVLGILVVEYGLGISLGVLAAARPGSRTDLSVRGTSLVLFATPTFWLALLLIDLLAVRWGLFPVGQMSSDGAAGWPLGARLADRLHHLVLPSLALGLARSGAVVGFVRNGLLEVMGQDYIRTARMLGIGGARIFYVHALKNAIGPLVQRFGATLPGLLSGSVLIEVIFGWPGLGLVSYQAVLERDYPLILASTALSGTLVVTSTLATDLFQAWIDPRVRDAVQ